MALTSSVMHCPAPTVMGIGAMRNCTGCAGELLLAQGADATEVEAAFRRAMQIAQKQQAKVFELRSVTSLARFWLNQGRTQESRLLLAPIYSWFTEGSETSDLGILQATGRLIVMAGIGGRATLVCKVAVKWAFIVWPDHRSWQTAYPHRRTR